MNSTNHTGGFLILFNCFYVADYQFSYNGKIYLKSLGSMLHGCAKDILKLIFWKEVPNFQLLIMWDVDNFKKFLPLFFSSSITFQSILLPTLCVYWLRSRSHLWYRRTYVSINFINHTPRTNISRESYSKPKRNIPILFNFWEYSTTQIVRLNKFRKSPALNVFP